MNHDDMLGHFHKILPEDYLTFDEISNWRFGPPVVCPEPDPRIGIGDWVKVLPFCPREGFPCHCLEHFSLLFVYSGSFRYLVDGKVCTVTEGDALFLAPGDFQSVEPCSENDYGIMIAMHPELLRSELDLDDLPSFAAFLNPGNKECTATSYMVFDTNQWPGTRWYIDELCCEHFDPDRRTYLVFPNLLRMIFIALDRCTDTTARKRQPTTPRTIEMVLRYMKTNYNTITLQTTAERFGFSPNYLSYMLKQVTGLGFQELKQNECMAQSARLLQETELSVSEIAQIVGIRNITHFYKLFSARYGVTPAQYRKTSKGQK